MNGVAEFLKAANERGRGAGTGAWIVDLGGVQNIDDPTVERVLFEHLQQALAELAERTARLGRHQLACLCAEESAQALTAAIDELDGLVRELGLGSVRSDRYALPRDVRALAARVGAIIGGRDPSGAAMNGRNRRSDLAQLLKIEQMIRRADISSLIHHQAIYDFARPRSPVTVARELTVSMDRMAETLGIPVAENPWLFDKVTQLLDRRMLFHLVQDRSRHVEPFAVNLRVATVLAADFPEMVARLAARDHETLIVELPQGDRTAEPRAFDAAVEELDRLGIHVACHAGGWEDLRGMVDGEAATVLQRIDFLKVRWDSTDLDQTPAETARLKALVDRLGPHRVVLERAESEAAIDFALGLGMRLLQGFGVTEHVRAKLAKDRDRAAARTSRAARQKPAEEAAPDNGRGVLRKMFRL